MKKSLYDMIMVCTCINDNSFVGIVTNEIDLKGFFTDEGVAFPDKISSVSWHSACIKGTHFVYRYCNDVYDMKHFISGDYLADDSFKYELIWEIDENASDPDMITSLKRMGLLKSGNDKRDFPIKITEDQIYILDQPVLSGRERPYNLKDVSYCDEDYSFIGVHSFNPGCYEYLDRIVVVNNHNFKFYKIFAYLFIGSERDKYGDESKLQKIWKEDGKYFAKSEYKTIQIFPKKIFSEDVKPGDIFSTNENKEMKDMFLYEVLEDYGILMTLKDGVSKLDLLKFHGFNAEFDTFKIWDLDKSTSYFLLYDSVSDKTKEVSWGNSTSCVSGSYWQRRDGLLDSIKKVIPNHPAYKEEQFVKIIE